MTDSFSCRMADPLDAVTLACLGAHRFREIYRNIFPADVLERRVLQKYSVALQCAELEHPARRTVLLECDGEVIGFSQQVPQPPPPFIEQAETACPELVEGAYIERLYITNRLLGRGFGTVLLDASISEARRSGSRLLWLGVMEGNERANRFYEARGFVRRGRQPFLVEGVEYSDLIMTKEI